MSQNESSSFGQEFEELSSQEGNSPTQKNPLIFPEVNKSTSDQDRRAALKETLETLSSLRPDDALDKLSIDSVIKFFIALYLAKQNSINADKANELNGQLKNVEEKMNNTQEKLQRNYVTILGIFAAIVFTFAAGTSFTSSVLETMASVSIYRLILMVALLAFVLFNSIYALFLFICRVSKFNEGKHLPKIICITSTFFAWDGQFLTH